MLSVSGLLENLDRMFLETVRLSLFGSVLIGFLFVLTFLGRNRISPRIRFGVWLLVPVQLLFFLSISSPLSLKNLLSERREQAVVATEPNVQPTAVDAPFPKKSSFDDFSFSDSADDFPFFDGLHTKNVPENLPSETTNDLKQRKSDSRPQPDLLAGSDHSADHFPIFASDDDFPFFEEAAAPAVSVVASPVPIAVPPVPVAASTGEPDGRFGVISWCALSWTIGLLSFYGCSLFRIFRLHREILAAQTVVDPRVLQIFEECKLRIRLRTWVVLVESDRIRGPFLIGVFRPVIVVPCGLVQSLGDEECRDLLSHELAHLKRGDLIVGWIMSLALGLHWFNPFVWFALRMMNHLREEAADAAVLEHWETERQLDYGNTLLTLSRRLAEPRFVPGIAGILETRSFLQRRIEMITRPVSWKKSWAVLALGVCLVFSFALLTDAKPQEKAKEPSKEASKESPSSTAQAAKKTEPAETINPKRVPKIVNTFPKNKAKGVDPNITQVYITFDIPMGDGMAWAQRSNQTALDFDEEKNVFWTTDKKTCVAPVRLMSGKTYETLMNFKPFIGFASEAGVPSEGFFYTFSTRKTQVSEESRKKYETNDLSKESDSPEIPTAAAAAKEARASEADKSKLDPALQEKADQAVLDMCKRGGLWIFSRGEKSKTFSYHVKISSTDGKGEPREHDINFDRSKGMDWEQARGTTYYGILQALASVAEEDITQIRWTAAEFGDSEINLSFTFKEPQAIECGNGMMGSWSGYFSSQVKEGKLTLDAKTLMPKLIFTPEGIGERFGGYVKLSENVYAPKRVQVKTSSMLFDMKFTVYEPDLWLLEKSTYTCEVGDEKFGSVLEISDVFVNGERALERSK